MAAELNQPAGDDGLPVLPVAETIVSRRAFSADQMRQYALDAHTAGLDAGYALAQESIADLRAHLAEKAQGEPVAWIRNVEPGEIPDWPWSHAFVDASANAAIVDLLGAFPVYRAAPQPTALREQAEGVLRNAQFAIEAMLKYFTKTPSTLADSTARSIGHQASLAIDKYFARCAQGDQQKEDV